MSEEERLIKGYTISNKLAVINGMLASTGAVINSCMYGNPGTISLIMIGISTGFIASNGYQLYKIEKESKKKIMTKKL